MAKKKRISDCRDDRALKEILRTWRTMIVGVSNLSEEEALRCLKLETESDNRKDFVARLYGRFNRLRGERELQDWLSRGA